jgi:hypothetical protein
MHTNSQHYDESLGWWVMRETKLGFSFSVIKDSIVQKYSIICKVEPVLISDNIKTMPKIPCVISLG